MAVKGKVLVTGGAGFIGANLCRKLLKELEHPVICLDNLSTGRVDNIEDMLSHPDFTFIEHDITASLPEELGKVGHIFNLACPASPSYFMRDKEKTILTNVLGLRNVLRYAIYSRCETVFQASTAAVYGDPEVSPQREAYPGRVNPTSAVACYEESKRVAETLCMAYREQCGIRVKIARIFNTYGPGMDLDDGRVVASFLTKALRGQPLTLFGDGRQTRTFCYIDDLLDGIVRFAMHSPGDFTGPINLGSGEEYSIRELAEMVLEITGSTAGIKGQPLPPDVPRLRRPELSLAKQRLSWQPRVGLQEGLERTMEYFRTRLAKDVAKA